MVTSQKLLGLIIQSDLKWNEHIASVVADLVSMYISLEYCCVVCHYDIPFYLPQKSSETNFSCYPGNFKVS